jgi:hypothetical protein
MAENLIILVAVAAVVGVFFLRLFHVLARRERRTWWKTPRVYANPSKNGPLPISWRVAVVVLIVAVILAGISLLPWRNRKCAGRIVIRAGPRGAPLECVCDGGRLGTCFPPGP